MSVRKESSVQTTGVIKNFIIRELLEQTQTGSPETVLQ